METGPDVETTHLESPSEFIREVTVKYIGPRRKSGIIRSPESAAKFMRLLLKDNAREHFIALYMSGSHEVISFSVVSIGSANASIACSREVYQPAVLVGACSIIVGHNHPSGCLMPSKEDVAVTKRLSEAGSILGIKLLDHVIFGEEAFYSLGDHGMLP